MRSKRGSIADELRLELLNDADDMARVRVLEHLHGREISPSIASLLPTLSEDDNPLIAQVALSLMNDSENIGVGSMRLLLGSGGLRTPERQQVYFDEMASIFAECEEVVFIPYASDDRVDYTTRLAEFSAPSGVSLRNIDDYENAVTAIEEAKGLYVGWREYVPVNEKIA